MLTCITCSKQRNEEGEDGGGGAAARGNTKESVKTLTSQIKDMALKLSGAYKQCKPCVGSSSFKKGLRPYPDFDAISEGIPYPYMGGSSTSTPAWDFAASHRPIPRSASRFSEVSGGDRTPGGVSSCDVVVEDEEEPKEWMAQVEPGVHITFVSLPNGGNDLKRIRFSREMFNKWEAQRWWGENYEKIMELYNVQRFNRQALNTPSRSEDGRESSYSRVGESPMVASVSGNRASGSKGYFPHNNNGSSVEASRTTTSSTASMSNASEMEAEWVEQDGAGVYITIRQLADGSRELRRVRFSREKFGLMNAKQWWEENRERIEDQYL